MLPLFLMLLSSDYSDLKSVVKDYNKIQKANAHAHKILEKQGQKLHCISEAQLSNLSFVCPAAPVAPKSITTTDSKEVPKVEPPTEEELKRANEEAIEKNRKK